MVTHERDQVRVVREKPHGARAVPGGHIIALDGCVGDSFGTEPKQGLIFLQERLHRAVGIIGIEHLRGGLGHGNARATGAGQISGAMDLVVRGGGAVAIAGFRIEIRVGIIGFSNRGFANFNPGGLVGVPPFHENTARRCVGGQTEHYRTLSRR
jgi:hypothetical protein